MFQGVGKVWKAPNISKRPLLAFLGTMSLILGSTSYLILSRGPCPALQEVRESVIRAYVSDPLRFINLTQLLSIVTISNRVYTKYRAISILYKFDLISMVLSVVLLWFMVAEHIVIIEYYQIRYKACHQATTSL